MTQEVNDVMASYYRCRREDAFIDTFYELFLRKSPEIAAKFAGTNFVIQKMMLRQSLLEMLCFDREMAGTHEEIARLGRRHADLQITRPMFELWLDALCESVQKHDPEFNPEVEQAWRKSMRKGIESMIAASDQATES